MDIDKSTSDELSLYYAFDVNCHPMTEKDGLGSEYNLVACQDDTTDEEESGQLPVFDEFTTSLSILSRDRILCRRDYPTPAQVEHIIQVSENRLPPMLIRMTKSLPSSPVAKFQYLQWSPPRQEVLFYH